MEHGVRAIRTKYDGGGLSLTNMLKTEREPSRQSWSISCMLRWRWMENAQILDGIRDPLKKKINIKLYERSIDAARHRDGLQSVPI